MVIPYTDRTDYLAAITSEWAYVMAAEKLMGVEVPERAEYIRVIVGEMQRLASHLLWFGTFALDLGATTAFLYAFRERESLFDIFQKLTGARMLYIYLRVGGVRNDLYDGFDEDIRRFLHLLQDRLIAYNKLATGTRIIESRTTGDAVHTKTHTIAYVASGPVLRGCGVSQDMRKTEPYSVYDRFEFNIPVGEHGDVYSRYVVRMHEFYESIRIIRQAIKTIPGGPWLGDVPRRM